MVGVAAFLCSIHQFSCLRFHCKSRSQSRYEPSLRRRPFRSLLTGGCRTHSILAGSSWFSVSKRCHIGCAHPHENCRRTACLCRKTATAMTLEEICCVMLLQGFMQRSKVALLNALARLDTSQVTYQRIVLCAFTLASSLRPYWLRGHSPATNTSWPRCAKVASAGHRSPAPLLQAIRREHKQCGNRDAHPNP